MRRAVSRVGSGEGGVVGAVGRGRAGGAAVRTKNGPLDLVFLGTASQAPSRTRNVTGAALRLPSGLTMLIDCGEGTQHQARKASSVRLSRVGAIFLTHMHGDHIFGLPGMLCSLSQQRTTRTPAEPARKRRKVDEEAGKKGMEGKGGVEGRKRSESEASGGDGEEMPPPVLIVGVEGIAEYIRASMVASKSFIAFPLEILELLPAEGEEMDVTEEEEVGKKGKKGKGKGRRGVGRKAGVGKKVGVVRMSREEAVFCPEIVVRKVLPELDGSWSVCDWEEVSVRAAPLRHAVPCVGYSFQEPASTGSLRMAHVRPLLAANKEALAAKGIRPPERLLSRFKAGEVIPLPDGSTLDPANPLLMSPPVPGRKVVWFGDTCQPSPAAAALAKDADLLIHEATNALTVLDTAPGATRETVRAKTISHGHSTAEMAGAFAAATNPHLLLLTHFSGRYKAGLNGLGVMLQVAAQAEQQRLRERRKRSGGEDAERGGGEGGGRGGGGEGEEDDVSSASSSSASAPSSSSSSTSSASSSSSSSTSTPPSSPTSAPTSSPTSSSSAASGSGWSGVDEAVFGLLRGVGSDCELLARGEDGRLFGGAEVLPRLREIPVREGLRFADALPVARIGSTVCAVDFLRVSLDFRRAKDGRVAVKIEHDPSLDAAEQDNEDQSNDVDVQ